MEDWTVLQFSAREELRVGFFSSSVAQPSLNVVGTMREMCNNLLLLESEWASLFAGLNIMYHL